MSYLRNAFWLLCLAGVTSGPPAWGEGAPAWPAVIGASELFQHDTASGVALQGLDPVTYFLREGPQPGCPDLELVWGGVAWRFASEANRAAFERDPASYAPRIGGYDAQAASLGRIVDASPAIYIVSGQRLYLFRNDASRARFLADEAVAALGEERWAEMTSRLVR
jgi:hypothetical protein